MKHIYSARLSLSKSIPAVPQISLIVIFLTLFA